MRHVTEVARFATPVQSFPGLTAEDLTGRFEEQPRIRNESRNGDAGVIDPVFAADQVWGDERPIGPWQHVIVQPVDLAERRAHLADLRQEPTWKFRECQESLL